MRTALSTHCWTYDPKRHWFQRKWGQYDAIAFKDADGFYRWRVERGGSGAADGLEIDTGVSDTLYQAKVAAKACAFDDELDS